ncbi:MAG: nicotinate (nicotinamide) nucleotide adenylyltransferase [Candidatus Solibacter usitatus]|nr:nicotinate (nicotinamide) nucleotide adenylyltransferase [Candidatus Solibacter usitatus]
MSRLAIFGGAFDPIHNAHLAIAREAARQFRLDRVLFVPAAVPPHKRVNAPYEDRYRMVELALEGAGGGLEASRLEADTAQTYSIETIERLRPRLGPAEELFFLIGADAFAEIRTWRRWRDVIEAVSFIVVSRPGHAYDIPEGARVYSLEGPAFPESSSQIRRILAEGGVPCSLPGAVLLYIRQRSLYTSP